MRKRGRLMQLGRHDGCVFESSLPSLRWANSVLDINGPEHTSVECARGDRRRARGHAHWVSAGLLSDAHQGHVTGTVRLLEYIRASRRKAGPQWLGQCGGFTLRWADGDLHEGPERFVYGAIGASRTQKAKGTVIGRAVASPRAGVVASGSE